MIGWAQCSAARVDYVTTAATGLAAGAAFFSLFAAFFFFFFLLSICTYIRLHPLYTIYTEIYWLISRSLEIFFRLEASKLRSSKNKSELYTTVCSFYNFAYNPKSACAISHAYKRLLDYCVTSSLEYFAGRELGWIIDFICSWRNYTRNVCVLPCYADKRTSTKESIYDKRFNMWWKLYLIIAVRLKKRIKDN